MSNLNLTGWEKKNVRLGTKGLVYKIMDFDIRKYKWMTLEEIKADSTKNGILETKTYLNFIQEIKKYEDAIEESNMDFEKRILKRYYGDDEMRFTDAEIIETDYSTPIGIITSTPKLVKKIVGADFNSKTEAWGIDKEILVTAKKMEVEEIQLVDEYNNVYFYTTLSKYLNIGDEASWGKVYLPIKHFQVKKYGDKTPFYGKYLRNVK